MVIEGLVTPAIIHNGSYFFINLPIYADGLVDCWEMVDLELFRKKLDNGWVVTQIPDGERISVHGLGSWKIAQGRWELDAEGLYQRVLGLLRELNPEMENLYHCHGRTTRNVKGVNVSILGMPKQVALRFQNPESPLPRKIQGDNLSIFVRQEGRLYLADLRVFADGMIEIGRIPEAYLWTIEELAQAIGEGRVLTSPPNGQEVFIHQLGSFTIADEGWSAQAKDVLLEVQDLVEELNGRPDSVERCRALYQAYLENPTQEGRDALREAYEAIPEHNRMYVGDMDTKDIPVRMIIYGDEEIEGWSHRAVARAMGEGDLPEIKVPKPSE